MMLDRQRHKWGPVGHNCTRRRGTKKEGDNRKLCPFRHLVPSCPDKEEGNALGFLLWFPTPLPPQTTPNQLDTPILIFQSLRETTMSFYMKVPVGSQTTLQKLAIWALWGLGTACIFKRPWNRFILDHLNHPTLSFIPSRCYPGLILFSFGDLMKSGGLGCYGPRLIVISLLHLEDTTLTRNTSQSKKQKTSKQKLLLPIKYFRIHKSRHPVDIWASIFQKCVYNV